MILGIGVDTIEIDRFALWHTYLPQKLQRIFSLDEIRYCLENEKKSAERFAVRFAAREALYKALSHAYPDKKIPFLTLCAKISIKKVNSRPILELSYIYDIDMKDIDIHLSLTHSHTHATALIVIEKK